VVVVGERYGRRNGLQALGCVDEEVYAGCMQEEVERGGERYARDVRSSSRRGENERESRKVWLVVCKQLAVDCFSDLKAKP
jgi:hypothetical protein